MMERHVETLYCDDIRQEIHGKLSYMGVYSHVLLTPTFPLTLPKFGVSIRVVSSAVRPITSLKLVISKDEEIFKEVVVSDDELAAATEQGNGLSSEELEKRFFTAHFIVAFSPMVFEEPCLFRVRAITESEELRASSLEIRQSS